MLFAGALWVGLRKRSYLPAPAPLPTRPGLPRVLPTANLPHGRHAFLLSRRDEETAVWGIGQFVSVEPTRRLDIVRTVLATAEAAGRPNLRFQLARHAREVWLWLDESLGHSGGGLGEEARRFADELSSALGKAGLPVERARFWGLPEQLSSDNGLFQPSEVDERRDAAIVLIFTDCSLLRQTLNSASDRPRAASLLRQLAHWPRLAFVDAIGGSACLDALLKPFDLLALLPEQVPAFLAGASTNAVSVLRASEVPLISDELAWAAALALSSVPVDDVTAHLLREHLGLTGSPWMLGELRQRAQLQAGGLLFGPMERAHLLSWLVAASAGSAASNTKLGQALAFYRDLLDAEDRRRRLREPGEPWLDTPAEHHLRMQRGLLRLWDQPELAAQSLYCLYRDALAPEIRQHLARLGPGECAAEVERGMTVLPWAIKDLSPRARVLLRELGLGSTSLIWKPSAQSLRPPGRLPLAIGLCGGLSVVGGLGSVQQLPRAKGEPRVVQLNAPPDAVVNTRQVNPGQYEVTARGAGTQAHLLVTGGAEVRVTWEAQEQNPPDGGAGTDLAENPTIPPDLSSLPDLTAPLDLYRVSDLAYARKPGLSRPRDLARSEQLDMSAKESPDLSAQMDLSPMSKLAPAHVGLKGQPVNMSERIFFDFDRDTITPINFPVLDEVVSLLKARPDIKRIRIEGHTDNKGSDMYNLDLSHRRAQSVMVYLVEKHIETWRLTSAGFGFRCPLVPNDTPENRAQNSRVDFVIIEQEGVQFQTPKCQISLLPNR